MDNTISPRQRYAAIIESYYYTRIEHIDFKNTKAAADTINLWCKEATHDQIKQLVEPGKMICG